MKRNSNPRRAWSSKKRSRRAMLALWWRDLMEQIGPEGRARVIAGLREQLKDPTP